MYRSTTVPNLNSKADSLYWIISASPAPSHPSYLPLSTIIRLNIRSWASLDIGTKIVSLIRISKHRGIECVVKQAFLSGENFARASRPYSFQYLQYSTFAFQSIGAVDWNGHVLCVYNFIFIFNVIF